MDLRKQTLGTRGQSIRGVGDGRWDDGPLLRNLPRHIQKPLKRPAAKRRHIQKWRLRPAARIMKKAGGKPRGRPRKTHQCGICLHDNLMCLATPCRDDQGGHAQPRMSKKIERLLVQSSNSIFSVASCRFVQVLSLIGTRGKCGVCASLTPNS